MFGIDMGPSQGETGATNALQGGAAFATSQGENLLGNSSAFINALLSGDTSKISQLLAPQIGAIQGQANQAKATSAQFGTRSGGQAAYGQTIDDKARASVNDMVSNLTSGAISEGASLGSNLLGQGMGGFEGVFNQQNTMQNQRASKWNDIFKDSLALIGGPAAAGGGAATSLFGGA
jgi:hypothetical protein